MRVVALGVVLAAVAGCTMNLEPEVSHIGGGTNSGAAASGAGAPSNLVGEPAFAAQVARSSAVGPVETVSGNWHLRGINSGSDQGCQYVSITNLDLHRTTHYSVCGSEVRTRNDVAPTYPTGGDAERIVRSVQDSAWRNGRAEQQWGSYQVSGVRVGPARADGCATVSTTITYNGMLVRNEETWVCH